MSEELLTLDKEYEARILFGVRSETQDIEGKVLEYNPDYDSLDENMISDSLNKFFGEIDQFVSPFSSVKVQGNKLRKVLRDSNYNYEIKDIEGKRIIFFTHVTIPSKNYSLEIPSRKIKISKIELKAIGKISSSELTQFNLPEPLKELQYADIVVRCSKGTYIRQLAEDIGKSLNIPAVLISLRRTSISKWTLQDSIKISDLENLKLQSDSDPK